MKQVPKHLVSRRQFIELTLSSACAASASGKTYSDTSLVATATAAELAGSAPPGKMSGTTVIAHETVDLNGVWSLIRLPLDMRGDAGYRELKRNHHNRLPAQVPGEVHLDLMRVGRMDDPNVSDNARARCRWPERYSWWYVREFTLPQGFLSNLRQCLIFDGIDLYGEVFINGKFVGISKDTFSPVEFDLRERLRESVNELVVRVTSGMELPPQFTVTAPEADRAAWLQKLDPIYTPRRLELLQSSQRKPRCAYGTDFCDPLPNIGIWRSVRLEGRTKVVIHHIRLDTVIQKQEVSLDGEVIVENLHPWSEQSATLQLELLPPVGAPILQNLSFNAQLGRSALRCHIIIPDPQLWWPNGMGEQPLYQLTARVVSGDVETDRRTQVIGLRTMELDRLPLPEGSRFAIRVNGIKMFCKGGNWAPSDLILARTTPERYQKLIDAARNAHFNMLRVNGDCLYESDVFYDACDRAGILVWQEFALSDAFYRDWDPEFVALVRNEAEQAVRRLRHHPSLALWCGNNECQWAMANSNADPTRPSAVGGVRIYNELLPDICRFYDPARPYWPGSPSGGTSPNNGLSGDFHGLGIDTENLKLEGWREAADASHARFVSESYAMSPPTLASVKEYLNDDELTITSTGWRIHTNDMERGTTALGIGYHYGNPKDLPLRDFILYGQMFQALIVGGLLEALRFRKNDPVDDCQGLLVWSYNDTWGELGWSVIDHYLRCKASYYWLKRAAAPVKVLVRSRGEYLVTRVVNDTLSEYRAVVRCGWVRLDGTATETQLYPITVPANDITEVTRITVPPPTMLSPQEWLYAATLERDGVPHDQAIWLLAPHRDLALGTPSISVRASNGMLEVTSPIYCHGVHLEDEGQGALADNYIDLLPGVTICIPIIQPTPSGEYLLKAVMPIESAPS